MYELISRKAVIDALDKRFDNIPMEQTTEILQLRRDLRQLPSAEPKIIYCGECTKMKVDSVFHDCWCSETGKKVWINHYCGYAERKEGTT